MASVKVWGEISKSMADKRTDKTAKLIVRDCRQCQDAK